MTPNEAPKCPPVTDTTAIVSSLNSVAKVVNCFFGNFLRSEGKCILSKSFLLYFQKVHIGAPKKNPPSTTKLLPRDADARHIINCGPPYTVAAKLLRGTLAPYDILSITILMLKTI